MVGGFYRRPQRGLIGKGQETALRWLYVNLPEPLFFRLKQLAAFQGKPTAPYVVSALRRVFREDDPLPVSSAALKRPRGPLRLLQVKVPGSLYLALRTRALRETGVDDRTASDRLGHADPAYMKRAYVHGVAQAQARAAEAANELLTKSGRFSG